MRERLSTSQKNIMMPANSRLPKSKLPQQAAKVNTMISAQNIQKLKDMYPVGSRVRMLSDMDDPYGQGRRAGDTGTVTFIDDIGQIHVKWDNGGSLAIVPEIDKFTKI